MYQIVNYYHENNQRIVDYKLKSRYLWEDHIGYTRNAVISLIAGLPDVEAVSARLIKNQEDIGLFISPYYPTEQVTTLVNLLKTHIELAVNVVNGVAGAEDQWRANGNDIVNQMSTMNSMFWPVSVIAPLWSSHLNFTIAQINARKNNVWSDDIIACDNNHMVISDFADIIAKGVIYQNLDMFCYHCNEV